MQDNRLRAATLEEIAMTEDPRIRLTQLAMSQQ
jgi:hypothetical protein